MSLLSRRELLTSGIALSAASLLERSLWAQRVTPASERIDPSADASTAFASREQLLFDSGWKFKFGHGNDPSKDLDL